MGQGRPRTTRVRTPRTPHGPIATARRWSSAALALASTAIVGAWALGIIMNDRWHWSQWFWWLPTAAVVAAAWLGIGLSALIDPKPTGGRNARTRSILPAPRRWRRVALIAAAAATLALAAEARPRAPLSPALTTDADARLSITYWNLSWADPDPAAAALRNGSLDADILVIANPRPGGRELANAIAERFASPTPTDPLNTKPERPSIARAGLTTIASRLPIRAHGRVTLEPFDTPWSRARVSFAEGITFVELDHPTNPTNPITLWIVDLPSDPAVHRPRIIERMRTALNNWDRRVTRPDGIGRWRSTVDDTRDHFPAPDIVVGDFNTPRGSRSLAPLVEGLTESHAAVGLGLGTTWPRPVPLWAIDLAFTNPSTFTPVRTESINADHALHHAIRLTVAPTAPPIAPPTGLPPQTSGPPKASPPDP